MLAQINHTLRPIENSLKKKYIIIFIDDNTVTRSLYKRPAGSYYLVLR